MLLCAFSGQVPIKKIMSKEDYVNGMETFEFAYEWTIRNFGLGDAQKLISPSFSSCYSDANDEWFLEIEHSGQYLWVELRLQSFNNISQYLLQTECKISNNCNDIYKEHTFSKFPDKIRWDISRSNFLNARRHPQHVVPMSGYYSVQNNNHSQNNELKICCRVTMSKKPTNDISDVISTFDATQQLSADLKKLLLNEKSADVTIQVGQKSFRAIKGILAVRSPVFSATFNHEQLKENENNKVVIEDIDEDVFEEFLHYIYTGESPNVNKMPMELLAVAEKYQVDGLKNVCEKIISGTVNFDNFASIFVFSDKYNLEKLNEKCLEFMKKNLQAVLKNETFKAYKKKHPEIFVSVLEELLLSAKSVNYS